MTSNVSRFSEDQVATIAGAGEVDLAIGKFVVAFGADPVARWMY